MKEGGTIRRNYVCINVNVTLCTIRKNVAVI